MECAGGREDSQMVFLLKDVYSTKCLRPCSCSASKTRHFHLWMLPTISAFKFLFILISSKEKNHECIQQECTRFTSETENINLQYSYLKEEGKLERTGTDLDTNIKKEILLYELNSPQLTGEGIDK